MFRTIKETSLEAKRILEEAKAQAERIKKEGEQKASSRYGEVYAATISQAEQKAIDLKRDVAKKAEHELKDTLCQAEQQVKEIEAKATKNFERAVNIVLDEIID